MKIALWMLAIAVGFLIVVYLGSSVAVLVP